MDVIKSEYKNIDDINTNKKIKIEVYYDLGGMSYLSGACSKRGYYLSVCPVTVSEHCVTYNLFTGYKILLLETKRKSKKKEQEAIELSYSQEQSLINQVLKDIKNN